MGERTSITTSYGDTIHFDTDDLQYFVDPQELFCVNKDLVVPFIDEFTHYAPPMTLQHYQTRLGRAYLFIHLLRDTEIAPRFGRLLDIGCGSGIQPSILKGIGIADHAVGVDIKDYDAFSPKLIKKYHRRCCTVMRFLDSLRERALKVPAEKRSKLQSILVDNVTTPRKFYKHEYGLECGFDIYRHKMVAEPVLDERLTQDVCTLPEDNKFDLVTSFNAMGYLDTDTIFAKIAKLLNDGGTFFMTTANWWRPYNPTCMSGHFPYAVQRLDTKDYGEYTKKFFPDYAERMEKLHGMHAPDRPTLTHYIEHGMKHGLVPVTYKICVLPPDFYTLKGLTPVGMLRHCPKEFEAIMEQIHRFRPEIRLQDLLPHFHAILFRKADPEQGFDAEKIRAAQDREFDVKFADNKDMGAGLRMARSIWKRFFR